MEQIPVIVRCTPDRLDRFGPYLRRVLPPHTTFLEDRTGNAMLNFLASLRTQGQGPALHLEDDVILTKDFMSKALAVIDRHPFEVIQFFGRSKDEVALGSRYRPGSTFSMNQCYYLPVGVAMPLHDFYPTWERRKEGPTAYDWMMADFMKRHGMRYWITAPSLVDHREGVSSINPRRPRKRASSWFEEPDYPTAEEERA